MSDPRLNSLHLGDGRREEFRKAREVLLDARGAATRGAEGQAPPEAENTSRTQIERLQNSIPPGLEYAIVDQDRVYPLKIGLNTIGRLPDNDVVLPDLHVSRRHCAILIHASDGCEVHDVASKNGTYLNGRRLTGPTALACGDEIRLSDRPLVFIHKGHPSQGDAGELTQSE